MLVVVSYDVSTIGRPGRRRLRRVARVCTNYGQRVQQSVFECVVDPSQWTMLRHQLLDIVDPEVDSLRFFFLGSNWKKRIEHHGVKTFVQVDEPLIT